MINDVATAISQGLDEAFGDGYEHYIDDIPQGFQTPCFFILLLRGTQTQIRGSRYFREHEFDIHYFPQAVKQYTQEINAVAERLMMNLEYVNLSTGPIRGTDMRYEVQDGVLHFFVHYDFFIWKVPEEVPLMQELHQSQKLKG
ncbi:hypothetical protein P22_1966 [Propionispora sp. 2/2-37]|uniref:phage tail terminator family protein n=1 Tax=Propionispora sp. 2/2-37 TaxID=1677858 RepID=UPI0006BB7F09|nr:hypothetical protein [Propionispora sp. 2/2-37]CUH95880.1 hypothetical protein P22_1966 [Propionispora sp. 2/2-37]